MCDRKEIYKFRANTIGISEAEVISILGESTSNAVIDTPGLYWCCGSDIWYEWEYCEVYCGNTMLEMSRGDHDVVLPH